MLSHWPAYFDSKTGTNSFYDVDYNLLSQECGVSFQHIHLLSSLDAISSRSTSFILELKIVFDRVLSLIKEGLSQQQPCLNNKKVSKFINNVLMYICIEKFYLRTISEEGQDLEVSPSFSFVIQRSVRLVKDVHLMCVYAEKKETQEFTEIRRIFKEIIRSVRKECVGFIQICSKESPNGTTNPLKEILVAQFLQLIKFLVNFTRYKDHKAYVSASTGGAAVSSHSAPDIWSITDSSVRQSALGNPSLLLDTRRGSEVIHSLMAFQTKSRNSVSTVQDLCSLNDVLIRKKSFVMDELLSQEQKSPLKGLGAPFGLKDFSKATRRKTAGNQDRPGKRLLDKEEESQGMIHAQTDRHFLASPQKYGLRREKSLSVTTRSDEKSETSRILETKRGEPDGLDRVIEEENEEMSPKRRRNIDFTEAVDAHEDELEQVLIRLNDEEEVEQVLIKLNEEELVDEIKEEDNKLQLINLGDKESMTFTENIEDQTEIIEHKEENIENVVDQEGEKRQEDETFEESSPRKKFERPAFTKKKSIYDFGITLEEEQIESQLGQKESLEENNFPRGRIMTKMLERLKESEAPKADQIKTRFDLDDEEGEASPKVVILKDNRLHLQSVNSQKRTLSLFGQEARGSPPKSPPKNPEKLSQRKIPELKRLRTVMAVVDRFEDIDTPKVADRKPGLNIVDGDCFSPKKNRELMSAQSPSPVKRKRCASMDATPRKWMTRSKPKADATPREQKKDRESYMYRPKPHHTRRQNFLENLFGKQTKEKVEQCFDEAHELRAYKHAFKDDIEGGFANTAEVPLARLTGVPFTVSESHNFFTALRGAREQEALESDIVEPSRGTELWEIVRNAFKTKRLLRKVGYDKSKAFPPVIHNHRKLLACLEKGLDQNIGSFKYRNIGLNLIETIGPLKKTKQASYKKSPNQGVFLPEDRESYEAKDLEVSLMLARLTYSRNGRWSRVMSFRSKDNGSNESRSKDNSRDISFSRDGSQERSGSAFSFTKRPGLFRSLFRLSSPSQSQLDSNGILSPSNRSRSDSRDSREFSPGIGSATSKPSLFKSLFKLNPITDTNSSSPRSARSRASSKDSIKERDSVKENNDSIGGISINGSVMSCPKKPSLFKSIFKSSSNREEEEEVRKPKKELFVLTKDSMKPELRKLKSILAKQEY